VKARGIPLGYVEGLNDAKTLLAEFFSSLLVLVSIGEGSITVNVSQEVTEKYGRTELQPTSCATRGTLAQEWHRSIPHEECVTCLHREFQIDYG
jgi:Zn ribbon nucleic-acid-binding protein